MFSIGYILQNLQEQDSKINLTALYHQVSVEFLKMPSCTKICVFIGLLFRVVSLKFKKIGNVLSILIKKAENVFLNSHLIYYKVVVMNYPQALTIGKTYMKVFFSDFSFCFFIDRFAEKYNVNGIEYRTLTKVYGLRFVLTISGKGRRFDIVRLFIAIGMS